jgi:hypothetical protein
MGAGIVETDMWGDSQARVEAVKGATGDLQDAA